MKNGRLQCKDIPDWSVTQAVIFAGADHPAKWATGDAIRHLVVLCLGFEEGVLTDRLMRAKLRSMKHRGIVDGCACGCRGDWHLL